MVTYHCWCLLHCGAHCAAAWLHWPGPRWAPPPSSCWTCPAQPPARQRRTSSFYLFLASTPGRRCPGLRTEWSDHWGLRQTRGGGAQNKKCNKRPCCVIILVNKQAHSLTGQFVDTRYERYNHWYTPMSHSTMQGGDPPAWVTPLFFPMLLR